MENRIKKLRYRSWHRGCKETDVILGQFSDHRLTGLDAPLLDIYEQLLDEDDANIWNWITGKELPDDRYRPLIAMLKQYTPDLI